MKIAAFVSVLLLSLSSSAFADTWTVNSPRDLVDQTPGDGTCSTGATVAGGAAECTLRAAVHEANARRFAIPRYHVIRLPAGVYRLGIAADPFEERRQFVGFVPIADAVRNGDLDIFINLTIIGDGPGLTVIDGGDLDRVFDIWANFQGQVGLQQLTIQNGFTPGPGGCIYHRGGDTFVGLFTVNVENCVSHEQVGGGMYSAGYTELTRTTFRGNTAVRGGGFENGNIALIEDSTFDSNRAAVVPFSLGLGGGISNIAASGEAPWFVMRNSTISNNSANQGGGLLNHGSVTMTNSTVSGNRAERGAGIAFFDAPTPAGRGAEDLVLVYTTVTNNDGTGIARVTDGRLVLSHTIVAGNGGKTPGNCEGGYTSGSYNLEDGSDCGFTGTGDLTGVDPLLGPLADNGGRTLTHALLAGSPAIDAGLPRGAASERRDQRGTPRPLGAATDIGAFEYGFDPDTLIVDLPLRWEDLFRNLELSGAITFQVAFSLHSVPGKDGTKDDSEPARIAGVKAAAGQGPLKYELDKSGRVLTVSGTAIPPKIGEPTDPKGPVLFHVEVQRAIRGAALLRVESASCDCDAKPAKAPPIVIPPFKKTQ